jgi:hypothetical protein
MRHKFQQLSGSGGDLWLATWEDLAEGDDAPHYSQRGVALTAQVSRDAHGVTILGRIAGDRFFPLNDSDTLPLTFSEPGIKSCNDMFQDVKPIKVGPGVATVAMIIRRN